MKIYKDILTGKEIFSDTYKIKLVDEVVYEVYGTYLTGRKGAEIKLDGANASADGQDEDEGGEIVGETGVDIVLNHQLEETFFDKKTYLTYLKDYMKKITEKLEATDKSQVDVFKTNINKYMKDILGRFKDLQFYTGAGGMNDDGDGMAAIIEYRDIDGKNIPVLMAFKHGLEEEKC